MNGAAREDCGLPRLEVVGDEASAILNQDPGRECAVDDKVELGRARMYVRRVHAAGAQEADGHSHAVTHESRKIRSRGCDGVTRSTGCYTGGLVQEIESELDTRVSTNVERWFRIERSPRRPKEV